MSTPGTDDEYAASPDIATVRRVQTRADGSAEMSEAVVQANQCADPTVATATRAAVASIDPRTYSAQMPIGARPATMDGVERAHT